MSDLANATARLERATWDSRAMPRRDDIRTVLDAYIAVRGCLVAVRKDIDDLVANSRGVDGLHMNGGVAEWDSLLPGGHFEEWLAAIEDADTALAQYFAAQMEA